MTDISVLKVQISLICEVSKTKIFDMRDVTYNSDKGAQLRCGSWGLDHCPFPQKNNSAFSLENVDTVKHPVQRPLFLNLKNVT